jgi:hypothetical protein
VGEILRRQMTRRTKISFVAKKKVAKPVRVKFYTRSGQKVSFAAKKKVVRPVKVEFYAKRKKK